MNTSIFWQKKRQELENQGKLPKPKQSQLPWWQDPDYTKSNRDVPTEPVPAVDSKNHDFSKASHLRDKSGNCPNCGSSDFMSSTASTAPRCFACGYVHGRQVND